MHIAKLFGRADIARWLTEISAEELILWVAYLDLEARGKLDYVPAQDLGKQLQQMWGTRANPNKPNH